VKKLFGLILFVLLIFTSCEPPYNGSPTINGLDYNINDPDGDGAIIGGTPVTFTCNATDEEGDQIIYNWRATGGYFNSTSTATVTWTSPVNTQTNEDLLWEVYEIYCDVTDAKHINQVQTTKAIIFTMPVPQTCVTKNTGYVFITNNATFNITVDCTPTDFGYNEYRKLKIGESTTYEMPIGDTWAWAINDTDLPNGGPWVNVTFNLNQCETKPVTWITSSGKSTSLEDDTKFK
jgi:hypothetical protein